MAAYPLHQCALYSIKSKSRLAERLCRTRGFLQKRAGDPSFYRVWDEPKSSGGFRTIEAPREDLKIIQKRIADLLQRVRPPEFLFSPVKGISYVDNALTHLGANEVRLLDVVNYFGNCTTRSVYRFFHSDLKCSPDVAWMLTGLTTRNGHLPQGSPCSPILSFYSCRHMWAEIAETVESFGCKVTVYVDDITVSGRVVPEALVWRIKQILHKFGHRHHKLKERRHLNRAAEITGLMITTESASVPHRHYRKMQAARIAARSAKDEVIKATETARARSLEAQIQRLQKLSGSRPVADK